jgi:hypothetical protein
LAVSNWACSSLISAEREDEEVDDPPPVNRGIIEGTTPEINPTNIRAHTRRKTIVMPETLALDLRII